jgi:uncharacterized membrane protein
MPEAPEAPDVSDVGKVRSLLPLVILGFILVVFALAVLWWPTGNFGEQQVSIIHHISRLTRPLNNEDGLNLPRRFLDAGIYLIVLAGVVFLVTAWRRGTRGAVLGLIGVSVLGLSYASGMALYSGPMVSTCGFLLILFGAVVTWATLREESTPQDNTDQLEHEKPDLDSGEAQRHSLDLGTDEYALHPIA